MLPLRFSLGAFAVLAFGAAAACSSSSSPNNAGDAGGAGDGSVSTPDATGPMINATCGVLAMAGGGTAMMCPAGQTCCSMVSLSGANASCVATGSCSGGISNECSKMSDCSGNQICCGGSADAGVAMTDAAAAGGFPTFDMSQLNTTCQASCAASQTQECAMDSECPAGQTCQALGAGNPLAGILMLPSICMAPRPDAGPPPGEDAGPVEDTGTTPPPPTPDADMADVAAGD